MTTRKPLVVFSHGKETGPNGRKIQQLRAMAEAHGAQTLSIDYTSTMNPEERVAILLKTELPMHSALILVGSSMGGYVSTVASQTLKPDGLLLMAPAFGLNDYSSPYPRPLAAHVVAVHGWRDEVVPVEHAIHWARLELAKLILVDDDHSLHREVAAVGRELQMLLARLNGSGAGS